MPLMTEAKYKIKKERDLATKTEKNFFRPEKKRNIYSAFFFWLCLPGSVEADKIHSAPLDIRKQ